MGANEIQKEFSGCTFCEVHTRHTPESGFRDEPVGAAYYHLESVEDMPGQLPIRLGGSMHVAAWNGLFGDEPAEYTIYQSCGVGFNRACSNSSS
jgi:hypothetical protein